MGSDPRVDDQVGADVHLLQVGVPQVAVALLHLVGPVQVLQRGLRDVDPAGPQTGPQGGKDSCMWVHFMSVYGLFGDDP